MAALSRFVAIPNACMSSVFHEELCSGDGVLKWKKKKKKLVSVVGNHGYQCCALCEKGVDVYTLDDGS